MWFFMTLYAQNVLGYSPLLAGLALIPSSLAVVSGAKLAPVLMRSLGARPVVLLGTAVAAAGFGWQSTMRADGTFLGDILGPGIVMMAGAGLAGTPLASLAVSGADPRDAGLVSGLINTSRTMGGALGLAILSTVAASATAGADAPEALTDGYALAFRTAAVMLAGAFLLGLLWLPRERRRTSTAPTASGPSSTDHAAHTDHTDHAAQEDPPGINPTAARGDTPGAAPLRQEG